jgi:hypothetical protein
VKRKKEQRTFDHYTEPSWKGVLSMLAISLIGIVLVWLAYSWALNQRGAPRPPDAPSGAIVRSMAWWQPGQSAVGARTLS